MEEEGEAYGEEVNGSTVPDDEPGIFQLIDKLEELVDRMSPETAEFVDMTEIR